jgi:hypothetical protein
LIRDGMMAEAAVDKAFKRAQVIFEKFSFD